MNTQTAEPTITERIVRTGNISSPFRQIVLVSGSGRNKTESVLPTRIDKVDAGLEFRNGSEHRPMEQYAFGVDGTTYERFADATAVVLQKHNVRIASQLADLQIYVRRALAIIAGQDQLRTIELANAKPAVGKVGR